MKSAMWCGFDTMRNESNRQCGVAGRRSVYALGSSSGLSGLSKAWRVAILVLAAVVFASGTATAQPGDVRIEGAVTDEVGVFSGDEARALTDRLTSHHDETGVQMAVLVVDTMGPKPIEDFSLQVAEEWGGGDAARDDGLLFTLAIDDRENRLEVGYGLEPMIPDWYASRTLDSIRQPLRRGAYAEATHRVIDDVVDVTDHLEPHGERTAGFDVRLRQAIQALDTQLGHFALVVLMALVVGFVATRRNPVQYDHAEDAEGPDDDSMPDAPSSSTGLFVDALRQIDILDWLLIAGVLAGTYLTAATQPEEIFLPLIAVGSWFVAIHTATIFEYRLGRVLLVCLVYAVPVVGLLYVLGFGTEHGLVVETIVINGSIALMSFVMGLTLCIGLLETVAETDSGETLASSYHRHTGASGGGSGSFSGGGYSGGGGSFGGGGASGSW